MIMKRWFALAAFMCAIAASVQAQQSFPATFVSSGGKVRFWQTNHLSGGQGGACLIVFGFDGNDLRSPIETFSVGIRVVTHTGVDLGVSTLSLSQSLGGVHADRYREGTFSGPAHWPLESEGALSPLCDNGVKLLVESASGRQAGTLVDLVRFHQLAFTAFPRVFVKVKQ